MSQKGTFIKRSTAIALEWRGAAVVPGSLGTGGVMYTSRGVDVSALHADLVNLGYRYSLQKKGNNYSRGDNGVWVPKDGSPIFHAYNPHNE